MSSRGRPRRRSADVISLGVSAAGAPSSSTSGASRDQISQTGGGHRSPQARVGNAFDLHPTLEPGGRHGIAGGVSKLAAPCREHRR